MIDFKFIIHNFFDKKNNHIDFHFHNYYELIYYVNGKGYTESFNADIAKKNDGSKLYYYNTEVDHKTNKFNFINNSYIIYPPYTIHNEFHEKKAEVICIGFYVLNENKINLDYIKNQDLNYNILNLLENILKEYKFQKPMYDFFIENILSEILITIYRESNKKIEVQNPMIFIKHYIDENFTENIDLEKLASLSGYSKTHFSVLFKNYTGISPKQYIMQKKYTFSKDLINNTNMSLSHISEMTGFNYYAQFHEFFLKFSGVSPKDLRTK